MNSHSIPDPAWSMWGADPLRMEVNTPSLMRFYEEPRANRWTPQEKKDRTLWTKMVILGIPALLAGVIVFTSIHNPVPGQNGNTIDFITDWNHVLLGTLVMVLIVTGIIWLYYLRQPHVWQSQAGEITIGRKAKRTFFNTEKFVIETARHVSRNHYSPATSSFPGHILGITRPPEFYFVHVFAVNKQQTKELIGTLRARTVSEALQVNKFLGTFLSKSFLPFFFESPFFSPQESPDLPWKNGTYTVWHEDHHEHTENQPKRTAYAKFSDYREAVAYGVEQIKDDLSQPSVYDDDWWIEPEPGPEHFDSSAIRKVLRDQSALEELKRLL